MSKKKAIGNTMTLKDFHGGSIPTDLPLPSAPGVVLRSATDRPGYDRASWGNPMGRSDQRARPSSSPSIRNFDDKTPFLTHTANIGRNFDEDERKPLDGPSAPRRMVNDDSFRVPSNRVEVKSNSVSTGRPTGWQGIINPYSGRGIDAAHSGVSDQMLVGNSENSVSGAYPNAWGARKEATVIGSEPGPPAWSAQTAVSKLVNASAVEKVSLGTWQSKLVVPGQVPVEVVKHSEVESGRTKNIDDTLNRGDMACGRDSSDLILARHLERGLVTEEGNHGGRKTSHEHEKARATHNNGLHPTHCDARYVGPEAQPIVSSEVMERPKLKLLPRTKPLEKVEKPLNDAKQESGTSIIGHPETGGLMPKSTNPMKPGSSANESGNQAAERPKLNLKPRSQLLEHSEANSGRNSVFGGARPRELVLKERGIDETDHHELVQQPDRSKTNVLKTERAPEQAMPSRQGDRSANVPHEMRTRKFDKKDNRSAGDAERSETQRRNWRNNDIRRHNNNRENERQLQQPGTQEKRHSSPETWRKPIEPRKPDSPDGSGLRYGKAASALELAQAFSKPFSDPKPGNGFNMQRGVSDHNQVPFSRLMDPTPAPAPTPTPRQINGY